MLFRDMMQRNVGSVIVQFSYNQEMWICKILNKKKIDNSAQKSYIVLFISPCYVLTNNVNKQSPAKLVLNKQSPVNNLMCSLFKIFQCFFLSLVSPELEFFKTVFLSDTSMTVGLVSALCLMIETQLLWQKTEQITRSMCLLDGQQEAWGLVQL